jgi:hypothetical protein
MTGGKKPMRMYKKSKGGFVPIYTTEEERVTTALNWNYTPLIDAIIKSNSGEVRRLLQEEHVDPNQRDYVYNWFPLKWVSFVRGYGINHNDNDYIRKRMESEEIQMLLLDAGAVDNFDSILREYKYNFSPVITSEDHEIAALNNEEYEEDEEAEHHNTGGARRRLYHKNTGTMKKRRKSTRKGGSNVTEQTRINDALAGNYTPLINAIVAQEVASVETILENGGFNEYQIKILKEVDVEDLQLLHLHEKKIKEDYKNNSNYVLMNTYQ